jgi:transcriptional regulator with XRE-family HTH domain
MRDHGPRIRIRAGRAIRRLRLLRGLSQERLAELAGNSSKHVGQIERAEVNVGLDVLAQIADALSVDVSDLFVEPRIRPRSQAGMHVISDAEIDQIEEVLRRVKSPRARRSNRTSE